MSIDLWPLIVYAVIVLAIVGTMLGLSFLLGQRRRDRATTEQYESGVVPLGDAQFRISVHFYVTAILFIIFDLEVVFLFIWAVSIQDIGWMGFWAGALFIVILLIGLIVEWRSGALDWRTERQRDTPREMKSPGGVVNIPRHGVRGKSHDSHDPHSPLHSQASRQGDTNL